MGISDLLYALDFNVQDTNFSKLLNSLDRFFAKKERNTLVLVILKKFKVSTWFHTCFH